MSRTADLTSLNQAAKTLLEQVSGLMKPEELEALQLDVDSIGILLAEFEARQLAHDPVQWVLWHLLEHIMVDLNEVVALVADPKLDAFYDAQDDFIASFEEKLESRAKISCPRLSALLDSYWAEAEDDDDEDGKDDDGGEEDELQRATP
jgi:hypothetical protein